MGRVANISPLGLYEWDNTIFDLMQIPEALDKPTLINNLLAETAELEVLYPNPVVFKNLLGIWSAKQIDIWNRLYATTQYEYNPIENYNRYETGSESGAGTTTHSGTDTTTESTTHGGSDSRTEGITQGGSDSITENKTDGGSDSVTENREEGGSESLAMSRREGGTQSDSRHIETEEGTTLNKSGEHDIEFGGTDTTTHEQKDDHYIAGYDSVAVSPDDGLVKKTRDQSHSVTDVEYGKTEHGESSGEETGTKTVDTTDADTITFGKTETNSDTTTFGKTEETTRETEYGKTESGTKEVEYGKTENVTEQKTYGETINKTGGITHGETVETENDGSHELHAHGNIGVTTTQKLIREQRAIDLFNVYDIIIEDFKMRFCILVY